MVSQLATLDYFSGSAITPSRSPTYPLASPISPQFLQIEDCGASSKSQLLYSGICLRASRPRLGVYIVLVHVKVEVLSKGLRFQRCLRPRI